MALNLSSEFSFFEKVTGMMADAQYGLLQVTFEHNRFITTKNVCELYEDTKGLMRTYSVKDVMSKEIPVEEAFESSKSIANLVTSFAKYSLDYHNAKLDDKIMAIVNKPSGQFAYELTDSNTSEKAYQELNACLLATGYLFALEKK